jgi:CRISPR/Cas system-associated exonuclease Cas4 (RecB family)
MGYARELSWSLTRSKAMAECPRGAWFQYFVRGEKDLEARAYALRDLTTLLMAAGSAVDYVIARAMRAFRDDGEVLPRLSDVGVRLLRKQVQNSLAVVSEIQSGGRWDRSSGKWMPPLVHHYYGFDLGKEYMRRMEDRVATCLREFERGEAWERIRAADVAGWYPLSKLEECQVPSFFASIGLKVWAAVDFAMFVDGTAYVIDWKSGVDSPKAREDAQDQLAVYAMWACRHYGLYPDRVMVQAVWLQRKTEWKPIVVDENVVKAVAMRVRAEAKEEETRLDIRRNVHGKPIRIWGSREDFPTAPESRRCRDCSFRELCPDGRDACSHLGHQSHATLAPAHVSTN